MSPNDKSADECTGLNENPSCVNCGKGVRQSTNRIKVLRDRDEVCPLSLARVWDCNVGVKFAEIQYEINRQSENIEKNMKVVEEERNSNWSDVKEVSNQINALNKDLLKMKNMFECLEKMNMNKINKN